MTDAVDEYCRLVAEGAYDAILIEVARRTPPRGPQARLLPARRGAGSQRRHGGPGGLARSAAGICIHDSVRRDERDRLILLCHPV
jgi:hypothetical protein